MPGQKEAEAVPRTSAFEASATAPTPSKAYPEQPKETATTRQVSFFQPLLVELARAARRPAGAREDSLGHMRIFKSRDGHVFHIGLIIDGGYSVGAYDQDTIDEVLEFWHQQLTDLVTAILCPDAA